jgi:transposase
LDLQKPTARNLSWLLFKQDSELTGSEISWKSTVMNQCPEVRSGWKLASDFLTLFKTRAEDGLASWLADAADPSMPREFQRFASGIQRDMSAVIAAIKLRWSNGQAEGQINRLKTIKRQMYGRAGFEMLRRRFLVTS